MTAKNATPEVADWLKKLGWELTHNDAGGWDEDQLRVGRKVRRESSFSARRVAENGTPIEMTLPTMDRLLAAINDWEAVQRTAA